MLKNKSICFIADPRLLYGIGGSKMYINSLAHALSKQNNVYIVTTGDRKEKRSSNNLDIFIEKDMRNIASHLSMYFIEPLQLTKKGVMLRNEVDIYHINNYSDFGMIGYFVKNKPIVVTIHGYLLRKHQVKNLKWFHPFLDAYLSIGIKNSVKNADAIIAVDGEVYKWILSLDKDVHKKMYLIQNGVDIKRFSPSVNGNEVRERYGISEEEVVILAACRFSPEKCVEELVIAMKRVLENCTNARLLLVGNGPLESKLKSLVNKLGIQNKTIFIGPVPNENIQEYYAASDIVFNTFVQSSQPDQIRYSMLEALAGADPISTSLSTVEAMASGKVVVALTKNANSNIKGYNFDKDVGVLLPYGNLNILSDVLITLINSKALREKIGANAREYIVKNRSWDRVVEEVSSIYESLMR